MDERELAKQRCVNFFNGIVNPSSTAWYYLERPTKINITSSGTACYYPFIKQMTEGEDFLIVGTNIIIEYDYQKAFWDWLTCPETSPYREILQYLRDESFEFLKNKEGIVVGFITPNNLLQSDKVNRRVLVNFLQAARQTFENKNRIALWHKLVSNGLLTRAEAFAFCGVFQAPHDTLVEEGVPLKDINLSYSVVNTNHWPIVLNNRFIQNFEKGEIKPDPSSISDVFSPRNYDSRGKGFEDSQDWAMKLGKQTSVIKKGRFGTYRFNDLPQTIERYKSFLTN